MQASLVVIAAGERSIEAVLAAEALRNAARQHGLDLAIEIRSGQGVTGAFTPAQVAEASRVLVIGEGEAELGRFAATEIVRSPLGAALDDPASALAPLAASARTAVGLGTVSPATAPATGAGPGAGAPKRIVAVTSCPTGIAHTFMAAEGLQQAAKALGHAIRVETQGSVGAQDALDDAEIAAADVVIIAADREVDLSRFAGNPCSRAAPSPRSTMARD